MIIDVYLVRVTLHVYTTPQITGEHFDSQVYQPGSSEVFFKTFLFIFWIL